MRLIGYCTECNDMTIHDADMIEGEPFISCRACGNQWIKEVIELLDPPNNVLYEEPSPSMSPKAMEYLSMGILMSGLSDLTYTDLPTTISEKPRKKSYLYGTGHRRTDLEEKASGFRRIGPKLRPNDPCPCGSGKKYKHCCK